MIAILRLTAFCTAVALCSAAQPTSTRRSGNEAMALESRVERRLAESSSLRASNIRVSSNGAVVSLSGTVPGEEERQRAMQVARRTPGARSVQDNLTVARSPGTKADRTDEIPDDELAKGLAQQLARQTLTNAKADQEWLFGWEVEGPNWEFTVEADDGDIILSGTVNSVGEARRIVQDARAFPGVRSVRSDLRTGDFNPLYDPYGPYYPYMWSR